MWIKHDKLSEGLPANQWIESAPAGDGIDAIKYRLCEDLGENRCLYVVVYVSQTAEHYAKFDIDEEIRYQLLKRFQDHYDTPLD